MASGEEQTDNERGKTLTLCFRVFSCPRYLYIVISFYQHRHAGSTTSHRVCIYYYVCVRKYGYTAAGIIDFVQEVRATSTTSYPPRNYTAISKRQWRIAKRKSELQMIIRYPLPERTRRRWHNSTVVRAEDGGREWMGRETFDWWNRKQNPSSSPLARSPTLAREYSAFANYTEVILCEWVYRAWPGFLKRESFEFLCMLKIGFISF